MSESSSIFLCKVGIAEQEEAILEFGMTSKKVVITNDDAVADLFFKFGAQGCYGKLLPSESLSVLFRTNALWLKGNTTLYRIFAFG